MIARVQVDRSDSAPWRFNERQSLRAYIGPLDGTHRFAIVEACHSCGWRALTALPSSSAAASCATDKAHVGALGIRRYQRERVLVGHRGHVENSSLRVDGAARPVGATN